MNKYSPKFPIICYVFYIILLNQVCAQNNPPLINNISVIVDAQNSVVMFNYDLFDIEQDTMFVTLKISSDNGETYIYPTDSVSGDVGYPILSGNQKQILWYYDPDSLNNLKAKIVADDLYEIDISAIVATVDSLNLINDLTFVEGIRNRTTGFDHLEETKNYIENQFIQNDLQVNRHEFAYGNYGATNIIGRLPGQTNEEVVFIIDGHFDTVSNSPGADDNGSGLVGMLEAMRVLASYNFKHTIRFIGFDLEELGMVGSNLYVSEAIPTYEQIEGVFNFEMIGYYSDEPNSQTFPAGFNILFPEAYDSVAAQDFRGNYITNIANENSNSLKTHFDNNANVYVPELRVISIAVSGNGEIAPDLRRSDHSPFWDAGYNALFITDGGNFRNPNYHSSSDTIGTLNFNFMSNVVKATVATVATLADVMHCGVGVSDFFDISFPHVSISNSSTLDRFSLTQNFPNPFNSSTIISYSLLNTNYVTLKIFDIVGREIQTLVNESQNTGTYSVNFNAGGFSSGTYFSVLKVGNISITKKMLFIQ